MLSSSTGIMQQWRQEIWQNNNFFNVRVKYLVMLDNDERWLWFIQKIIPRKIIINLCLICQHDETIFSFFWFSWLEPVWSEHMYCGNVDGIHMSCLTHWMFTNVCSRMPVSDTHSFQVLLKHCEFQASFEKLWALSQKNAHDYENCIDFYSPQWTRSRWFSSSVMYGLLLPSITLHDNCNKWHS